MPAFIEMGLAWNETCVFEDHKDDSYKCTKATVHWHKCMKGTGVNIKNIKAKGTVTGNATDC